jgi:hypothetical protein
LTEIAHVVSVKLARGHAELVVRRTVKNGGVRHDQATFSIDLRWPPASARWGRGTASPSGSGVS